VHKSENAFRRVVNLRAFTHRRCAAKTYSIFSAHPHRFAFCPSAPLRQAVLRTSSWLAPSLLTSRPCDRPVKKTRDAPNRLLPPKRITCTRTSRVPDSLSLVSQQGDPTESWAPYGTIGESDVSRRPEPLRRIVIACGPRPLLPHGLEIRAWAFSSHGNACDRASDTPVAILALILSPHQASPVLHSLAVRPSFGKVGTGRRTRRPPRPPPRRLVKADACDDPGCLLSAGTLPSIQWPLQPWCHDRLTAFGDVATAEWHSRTTLGLRPVLSR